MKPLDILILSAVVLGVILAWRCTRRKKKRGCSACGGSCASCPMNAACADRDKADD